MRIKESSTTSFETDKIFMDRLNKLRKLESALNKAYSKLKNPEFFFESKKGSSYFKRWESLMVELRGYADYPFDSDGKDLTKERWKEYCEKSGISCDYNIGDVCA